MAKRRSLGKATRLAKRGMAAPTPDDDRYQAEDDLRTLTRAEEIRSDSGRLSRLRRLQQSQIAALDRVGRTLGSSRTSRGRSRSR